MKNGVYFIVIVLLVAKLFKILIYTNKIILDVAKKCKHFDSNYLFVPLSILLLYMLQDGYINDEDNFET